MSPTSTPSPVGDTSRALDELLAVWHRVMDTSPDDDGVVSTTFFDAGGNSMSAFQLAAALTDNGWQVDVADLFDDPTPRELAHLIVARTEGGTS